MCLINEPPTRLCCGQKHHGPVCPDGKVMCCLCFNRVNQDELHVLPDGQKEDVCNDCFDEEENLINKLKDEYIKNR